MSGEVSVRGWDKAESGVDSFLYPKKKPKNGARGAILEHHSESLNSKTQKLDRHVSEFYVKIRSPHCLAGTAFLPNTPIAMFELPHCVSHG